MWVAYVATATPTVGPTVPQRLRIFASPRSLLPLSLFFSPFFPVHSRSLARSLPLLVGAGGGGDWASRERAALRQAFVGRFAGDHRRASTRYARPPIPSASFPAAGKRSTRTPNLSTSYSYSDLTQSQLIPASFHFLREIHRGANAMPGPLVSIVFFGGALS